MNEIFKNIADKIKNMTKIEFVESLIKTGIIDNNGKLTEKYGGESKKLNKRICTCGNVFVVPKKYPGASRQSARCAECTEGENKK